LTTIRHAQPPNSKWCNTERHCPDTSLDVNNQILLSARNLSP
jgi:hypothetical protein